MTMLITVRLEALNTDRKAVLQADLDLLNFRPRVSTWPNIAPSLSGRMTLGETCLAGTFSVDDKRLIPVIRLVAIRAWIGIHRPIMSVMGAILPKPDDFERVIYLSRYPESGSLKASLATPLGWALSASPRDNRFHGSNPDATAVQLTLDTTKGLELRIKGMKMRKNRQHSGRHYWREDGPVYFGLEEDSLND